MEHDVVLYRGFLPETDVTVNEFGDSIRERHPEVNIVQTSDYDDAAAAVPNAETAVEQDFLDELLEQGSTLQWVQSLSASVNRYDVGASRATGSDVEDRLRWTHPPEAEHVFGLTLFFEREAGGPATARRAVASKQCHPGHRCGGWTTS
ncbi:D-isomer specific 2-hydroxyacid dehydrogenase NAD-binding protein [Halosimplex carlsbadense 2-9-1]|uniref:D-isomer specific 2-hydroxyacid dehydrogenase NAD-binding protein n=1 Tax=Halosimplex carlsbadense 2-9-1 TaxID=797114 RepID=M0CWH3_9EURY|nr:hypothetical protein [Halosimplex carlsbadense]ELZ27530.1 D-isomer specific 2-hydroxyacid dehydrogenase NAD-binding protein [Halosimplex carlsbadense 2-9-1]